MERDSFLHVRVPLALKERVAESARSNRRSIVREIQVLLERAVAPVSEQPQAEAR
jgi:hypothetical protein